MSSNDIDVHHLGAAYALDALDERERMAFEAHYPSCEVCRADVLAFRATLTHVATAQSADPPASMKSRVMAEIGHTRQLSPLLPDRVADLADLAERRRRRQRVIEGVLVAAAAIALFVATAVVLRNGDDQPASASALADVMAEPDSRLLTLVPGAGASSGTVKVAWSSSDGTAVLIADGLPTAPSGSAYELWLIADEVPQPMQVLQSAGDGRLRAVIDIDSVPDAWGVTIEPEGGSPAPTGDILFLGTA